LSHPSIQTALQNTGVGMPVVASDRRLPNWIESFVRYSFPLQTPEIFRRWVGIGIVSAALERKVWARTKGSNLYPNQYVVLIATPGVGKSQILSCAENMLRKVHDLYVAPSSLTTASMIDAVALAKRSLQVSGLATGTTLEFNSLQIIASELGVFLPAWESAFMNTLTKLYDGEHYEERRRTGKVNHLIIEHPLLSILGGATPNYLGAFLPEGAWEQGFTSRTIFIFSDEIVKKPIWSDEEDDAVTRDLEVDLIADLTSISRVYGPATFTVECQDAINAWYKIDLPPIPNHPKLLNYNTRRLTHLLKLSIIASLARTNERIVTVADYLTAKAWQLEAERVMPDIFAATTKSTEGSVADDVKFYIKAIFLRGRRPVADALLVQFLRDRTPHYNIRHVIDAMERAGEIKKELLHGIVAWRPMY
jgi:hypothetical protein